MERRIIELECARIEKLDSGVVFLKYRNDYTIELKDTIAVEAAFVELNNEQPIYCLMDTSGQFNNLTKEAQNFLAKDASIVKSNQMRASAVIIDNLPTRLIAKFFMAFYKPIFAMKIFAKKHEAEKWLIQLMDKENFNRA